MSCDECKDTCFNGINSTRYGIITVPSVRLLSYWEGWSVFTLGWYSSSLSILKKYESIHLNIIKYNIIFQTVFFQICLLLQASINYNIHDLK